MKLIIVTVQDLYSTTKAPQDVEIEFDFERLDGYVVCKVGYEENLFIKCDDLKTITALLSMQLIKVDEVK